MKWVDHKRVQFLFFPNVSVHGGQNQSCWREALRGDIPSYCGACTERAYRGSASSWNAVAIDNLASQLALSLLLSGLYNSHSCNVSLNGEVCICMPVCVCVMFMCVCVCVLTSRTSSMRVRMCLCLAVYIITSHSVCSLCFVCTCTHSCFRTNTDVSVFSVCILESSQSKGK